MSFDTCFRSRASFGDPHYLSRTSPHWSHSLGMKFSDFKFWVQKNTFVTKKSLKFWLARQCEIYARRPQVGKKKPAHLSLPYDHRPVALCFCLSFLDGEYPIQWLDLAGGEHLTNHTGPKPWNCPGPLPPGRPWAHFFSFYQAKFNLKSLQWQPTLGSSACTPVSEQLPAAQPSSH